MLGHYQCLNNHLHHCHCLMLGSLSLSRPPAHTLLPPYTSQAPLLCHPALPCSPSHCSSILGLSPHFLSSLFYWLLSSRLLYIPYCPRVVDSIRYRILHSVRDCWRVQICHVQAIGPNVDGEIISRGMCGASTNFWGNGWQSVTIVIEVTINCVWGVAIWVSYVMVPPMRARAWVRGEMVAIQGSWGLWMHHNYLKMMY